jgi:hypothetical protein
MWNAGWWFISAACRVFSTAPAMTDEISHTKVIRLRARGALQKFFWNSPNDDG